MLMRKPRTRSLLVALVAVCALLLLPAAASAKNTPARKLGRGLAALTCGFLEIPGTMYEMSQERGAAWGWTLGLAEGIGHLVPRHLVGVWETVLSPFPLPEGYAPIIQPEFPWDYFRK